MTLELKNIGMIKEASVKIDGLTVIAGENDTGKSTVGRTLYSLLKTIICSNSVNYGKKAINNYKIFFKRYTMQLFEEQISKDGDIYFKYRDIDFNIKILYNNCKFFKQTNEFKDKNFRRDMPLFIESPLIWNFLPLLNAIGKVDDYSTIEEIDFAIPTFINDLHYALTVKHKDRDDVKKIELNINDIIGGKFKEDNSGKFVFNKNGKNIELINTAMGIKYFAILQVLVEKNHLYNGQVLILDEPEVHLHPKWQLEMAKIIVKLVKNGVKVLVNSHSPYMIEALKRYSEVEEIEDKTNFYLAENGYIKEQESLENIFEKLVLPI